MIHQSFLLAELPDREPTTFLLTHPLPPGTLQRQISTHDSPLLKPSTIDRSRLSWAARWRSPDRYLLTDPGDADIYARMEDIREQLVETRIRLKKIWIDWRCSMAAMLKYLRIAVTALSLTACVLLIALWVRSQNWQDRLTRYGIKDN